MTTPTLVNTTLDDDKAERVRRADATAIQWLLGGAFANGAIIANVSLPNATTTLVAHGLGRAPKIAITSALRGAVAAGYINQITAGVDATKYVAFQANGYGATIVVDVAVA